MGDRGDDGLPFGTRRKVLTGLGAAVVAATVRPAFARAPIEGGRFGLDPESDEDQSEKLRRAIEAARDAGLPLLLAAGTYLVHDLALPGGLVLEGVPGGTILAAATEAPVATISDQSDVTVSGITFSQGKGGVTGDRRGLLEVEHSDGVRLHNCAFLNGAANSLVVSDAAADITGCSFSGAALAAIFAINSRGLAILDNRIDDCGNGGILVWRDQGGTDASILARNRISAIRADAGGNGQNGNGINVFRADGVVVTDNVIDGCAFTAVRVNSANDTQIRGNSCTSCGEVAIYSEFAFSGSLIADNIIDTAATGISITNFDQGGRLAVCSGNLVRNITARSDVNPDVRPVGIYAEADTTITGNVVDTVPGIGIAAGYGPYLRNVLISDNVVRSAETGIAVSVADGAGTVRIAGNLIAGSQHPLAGMAWDEMASDDLARDAAQFPQIAIADNTVSR